MLRSERARIWCALVLIGAALAGCDEAQDDPLVVPAPAADASALPEPDARSEVEPDAVPEPEPDAMPEPDAGEAPYTATLNLPETPYNYAEPDLPQHYMVETLGFRAQRAAILDDNTPADNPTTDLGATLGRVLFYDINLSANRTVACASCHEAEFGFSDPRVFSLGFEGGETERHSMGLTNARFYRNGRFFWDQRAATLEEQALMPFQDPVEMGMTLDGLLARVAAGDYYPPLFEAAFGDDAITAERIGKALAQFVRSMVSYTSRYDAGRALVADRSQPFPNFTDDENAGKRLFVMPPPLGGFGCFFCHEGEAFIGIEATSNGLDAVSEDRGYGGVTELPQHEAMFKVPSLRNVELRGPFMHDGRFATLEEVIEHYSNGVEPNPNLGLPFGVRNGQVIAQLNMSAAERRQLLAFLRTLTDKRMLDDPKFADPFVREAD